MKLIPADCIGEALRGSAVRRREHAEIRLLLARACSNFSVLSCHPSSKRRMKRAIGFRVEPRAVHWALVEGTGEEPVLVESATISAAKTHTEPEALSWFRARIKDLILRYEPSAAGIKYTEQIARGGRGDSARLRCRIEGVILQLLNEERLEIFTGNYRRVSGLMGSKSAKQYLDSDDLRGLDWSAVTKVRREAVLVAVAALGE